MKKSVVPWLAGLALMSALPVQASTGYAELSAKANSSIRWGLYSRAIDMYESVLADDSQAEHHVKARFELLDIALTRGDLDAARQHIGYLKTETLSEKDAKRLTKAENKIKGSTKKHKFAARVKVSWYRDTNASIASAGVGKSAPSFEDDEEDEDDEGAEADEESMDMDDFADFEDALDDIGEATEETQDDISEGEDLEEDGSGSAVDTDGDGVADGVDNDGDGVADAPAADADGDGVPDTTADANGDGTPDAGTDPAADPQGIAKSASGKAAPAKKTTKTGDHRVQTGFAAAYGYLLNDGGDRWNLLLNTSRTDQVDMEKNDSRTWAVSTGPTFYVPQLALKASLAATYVQLYKPQEYGGYQNDSTIYSLGLAHKLNKTVELGIKYNYETREFNDDEVPELDVDTFKVGTKLNLTKTDNLEFTYSPKVEDNSKPTKDKDAEGWGVNYARKLPWDSFAVLSYADKTTELVNDPKRPETRDKKTGLTLGHKLTSKLGVSLAFERKERTSNQPNKDATGRSAVVTGTYAF